MSHRSIIMVAKRHIFRIIYMICVLIFVALGALSQEYDHIGVVATYHTPLNLRRGA